MLKAFIFDMDGVIIDSEPLHFEVDLYTLNSIGIASSKEELEQYVGMTNPEMWRLIKKKHRLPQSIEELIQLQLTKKLAYLDESDIEPISGIRELIQELRDGNIPIGLASSSPRVFIEKVLSKFNILHEFACITSGEEVPKGKPAPDVYLETARAMNVEPEHCCVLEDAKHGVAAAKNAGMRCIGFVNPNSGNQDLSAADFIVNSIAEVKIREL
ncbi:HAD family hydrolase [Paenibacillus macerans]|uniref:HAD family hydrolase n=1 Tax=Paenibacillus macerans TaxID=44252 RepID=UPI0022E07F46|nr:HAD family phosphatase [Paenibacillus macerans]